MNLPGQESWPFELWECQSGPSYSYEQEILTGEWLLLILQSAASGLWKSTEKCTKNVADAGAIVNRMESRGEKRASRGETPGEMSIPSGSDVYQLDTRTARLLVEIAVLTGGSG